MVLIQKQSCSKRWPVKIHFMNGLQTAANMKLECKGLEIGIQRLTLNSVEKWHHKTWFSFQESWHKSSVLGLGLFVFGTYVLYTEKVTQLWRKRRKNGLQRWHTRRWEEDKRHMMSQTLKNILTRGWSMVSSGNGRLRGIEIALHLIKRRFLINWE